MVGCRNSKHYYTLNKYSKQAVFQHSATFFLRKKIDIPIDLFFFYRYDFSESGISECKILKGGGKHAQNADRHADL
jgi:hypothetical protein